MSVVDLSGDRQEFITLAGDINLLVLSLSPASDI